MSALTSWLVNPWLLLAGLAAMSLPIIIHLLNRRRYQIIDWAAMEFLLAAEKRNRRRIRLENLSLLVLRCLAVFFLGLLVARPFIPSGMTAGLLDAARFEHLVILDDSLSMQVQLGTETAFDRARRRLLDMLSALAEQRTDNSLTLILTSRPDQPLLESAPLQNASLAEITRLVENLSPSDRAVPLQSAIQPRASSKMERDGVNRLLYVFSDLRQQDWSDATITRLRELASQVQASTIVDCATDDDRNLTISELSPDGRPIAGQSLALHVSVKNQGSAAAENVRVRLAAGQSLPLEQTIARLAPQATAVVRFNLALPASDYATSQPPSQRITAELETREQGADDRLPADSAAYYAARTMPGIAVLLVDGNPSAEYGKSASFYLRRALAPDGPLASGVLVEVVSETDFEAAELKNYHVVFLLNTFRLGEPASDILTPLQQWVNGGGGLVIMPGDQVEVATFNAQFGRDGDALSPLRLTSVQGDEDQTTWAQMQIDDANHPLTRQFSGINNPLLSGLKIFRWWDASFVSSEDDASVLARLTNAERSPAIVERHVGKGQVIVFCIPADAQWHNWPAEPSYVLMMQELVRYLAADRDSRSQLLVGQSIREPIDLTEYEIHAELSGPNGLEASLQAAAPREATTGQSDAWEFSYPATSARGFYELKLKRRDGTHESRLVAANVDPSEGNLQRVDKQQLTRTLAAANVRLVDYAEELLPASSTRQSELWRYLLAAVVLLLFAEQLLGWHLGRIRS